MSRQIDIASVYAQEATRYGTYTPWVSLVGQGFQRLEQRFYIVMPRIRTRKLPKPRKPKAVKPARVRVAPEVSRAKAIARVRRYRASTNETIRLQREAYRQQLAALGY